MLKSIIPYVFFFDKYRRMKRILGFTDTRYDFFNKLSKAHEGRIKFIQIGSNDGLINDPIREFIIRDNNWSGIFIEPNTTCFNILKSNYSRLDQSRFLYLNIAITKESGTCDFWTLDEKYQKRLSEKEQLSVIRKSTTLDNQFLEQYLKSKNIPLEFIRKISVPSLSFNDLFKKHFSDEKVDLLVIDAEGLDAEIIMSINFNLVKIDSIFFETNFGDDIENSLIKFLRKNHFSFRKEGNVAYATR